MLGEDQRSGEGGGADASRKKWDGQSKLLHETERGLVTI